jgi:hypothetical protein
MNMVWHEYIGPQRRIMCFAGVFDSRRQQNAPVLSYQQWEPTVARKGQEVNMAGDVETANSFENL